jgi:uncharacterized membrane protein YeaQ/YmgE (transglycosylase-associated protein family)
MNGIGSLTDASSVKECFMEEQQMGWLAAILIGGFAGWLAEKFMKSNHGLFTNIVLGVIGAIIGNAIFVALGIVIAGWVGYLIAGFAGACLLIASARLFKNKKNL